MSDPDLEPIHPAFSLLILAGGEGRRMDGKDKGLQLWRGQPLVAHALAAIPPDYTECLISCNRNLREYAKYGTAFIDFTAGYQGPMAGIQAGLAQAKCDLVLVIPCDCPSPPATLFPVLYSAMQAHQCPVTYAFDGSHDQYLFALINKNAAPSLSDYIARGNRSVKHWYREISAIPVDFSGDAAKFANINTLQGLQPPDIT